MSNLGNSQLPLIGTMHSAKAMNTLQSPRPLILVAEDDAQLRELLQEGLTESGFEVRGAASGRSVLACIRERKPDLLLCDVMMPDGDGHDVLRAIRADHQLANLPVILLSALGGGADVRAGMNLAADDYLTKPVALTEIRRAVEVRLARMVQVVRGDLQEPASPVAGCQTPVFPEPGGTAGTGVAEPQAVRVQATRAHELAQTLGRVERRLTDLLVMVQPGWVRCPPEDYDGVVGALLAHALSHTRPGDAVWLVGAWEGHRYQLTLWSREVGHAPRESGVPAPLVRPLADSGLRQMATRLWATGGELHFEDCPPDGVRLHLHFQPACPFP